MNSVRCACVDGCKPRAAEALFRSKLFLFGDWRVPGFGTYPAATEEGAIASSLKRLLIVRRQLRGNLIGISNIILALLPAVIEDS
jgi:hypothetical protein